MKRAILILVLGLALSACATPGEPVEGAGGDIPFQYVHDAEHGVGCWIYGGTGNYGKAISCIPDQDYQP